MKLLRILSIALAALAIGNTALAGGGQEHAHAPEGGWPFEGWNGKFEKDSLQRGYHVYQQVCSTCHGMDLLSYRNLGQKGGPFYDAEYPNPNDSPWVKALADQVYLIGVDIDQETGEELDRNARPSDAFRSPYTNDAAGRAANNGALPPDLSVITKARHGGASYVYSLLMGYPDEKFVEQREEVDENGETYRYSVVDYTKFAEYKAEKAHDDGKKIYKGEITQTAGQYYNPYMLGDTTPNWSGDPRHAPKGGFLAMADQLALQVGNFEYQDGTPATKAQMAYDVSQFLAWAGEPKMENRKSLGLAVMLYLSILGVLLWFSYKQIWRNVDH